MKIMEQTIQEFKPKYSPLDPARPGRFILGLLPCATTAFKIWGLKATARTVWSSFVHMIQHRKAKPQKNNLIESNHQVITLLTFSIHPDLARIWYVFARRFTNPNLTTIKIVDCCGQLQQKNFPGAIVQSFCNFSHARKLDYWLYFDVNTPYLWLQDDDVMLIRENVDQELIGQFQKDHHLAVVSLAPRGWSFEIEGVKKKAVGTYSICIRRNDFLTERLSFSPVQTTRQDIGRSAGYYDTADYANEQLLRRGYGIKLQLDSIEATVCGFVGTSVTLLTSLQKKEMFSQHLNKLLEDNPQQVSYYLVGLFCNWKVHALYQHIFAEHPQWQPVVPESEIDNIAMQLPDPWKQKTLDLFRRYQNHYVQLKQIYESWK